MYSSESGRKLTNEEIDTFLKANNHGRPMNEDLPYIWVGKDAAATYSKWPRDAWHLYRHQGQDIRTQKNRGQETNREG